MNMYKGNRAFFTDWQTRTCSKCGSKFQYPRHAYDRIEKTKHFDEHGEKKKLSASMCLYCFNSDKISGSHYSLFGISERMYYEMNNGVKSKEDLLESLISISYSSGVRNAMRTGPRAEYINQMRLENALDGHVKDHVNSMSVQAFYWIVFMLEHMTDSKFEDMNWKQQMMYAELRRKDFTKFFESMGTQLYVTTAQNSELAKTVQGKGTLAEDYVKVMGRGLKQRGGYYTKQETINLIEHQCIGNVYGTIDIVKERFNQVYYKIQNRRNVSGKESTKEGFNKEYRNKEVRSI